MEEETSAIYDKELNYSNRGNTWHQLYKKVTTGDTDLTEKLIAFSSREIQKQ